VTEPNPNQTLTQKERRLLFCASFLALTAAGVGFAFRVAMGEVYGAELRAQARGADLIYAVEAHGALLSRLARRVAGELGLPFVLRDISQIEPTDADALLMQMVELWELTSDLEGPAPQRPEQQRQPDTAGDGQRVDQSQPDDQR